MFNEILEAISNDGHYKIFKKSFDDFSTVVQNKLYYHIRNKFNSFVKVNL